MFYKYPKTWHMPGSKIDPHGNDRVLDSLDHFAGREVIVSCKLDGENESLYKHKVHARSIDSGYHPSRSMLFAFHAEIRNKIPDEYRICLENLQAKHSIYYVNLPTYFFGFGIYNQDNVCLSWDDTTKWFNDLGITRVPVLYRGLWNLKEINTCYTGRTIIDGKDCGEQEGFVVRLADAFHYDDHALSTYKFVRPNHVPGNDHWAKYYIPNKLLKTE